MTLKMKGTKAHTLEGKILDFEALVAAAVAGDDRSIRNKRVVNTWKRHEVSLEVVQVDVEGTIETQAGGDRANNLGDETVEVIISRARDV